MTGIRQIFSQRRRILFVVDGRTRFQSSHHNKYIAIIINDRYYARSKHKDGQLRKKKNRMECVFLFLVWVVVAHIFQAGGKLIEDTHCCTIRRHVAPVQFANICFFIVDGLAIAEQRRTAQHRR